MNILHNLTRKQILIYSIAASVIVATLAVVIFSVNFHHTYPKELVAIDSLCDSKPDSVRLLLRKLSANEYRSEPDRMYYDLLKIKVANNLYEPQKDSTIFRVCDFFEDSRDKEKYRESCYYLGKYYVEHSDAPQALKCFQTALDLSDDKTPLSFKSKVYSQSGTLFLEQDMFDEALTMYRKSYTCDSLLRDTVNMLHSMRDIAQTCKYLNKVDVSESVLKDSYKLSISIDDKLLEESILLSLASLYKSKGEIQRAYEIYSVHLRNVDDRLLSPTNCLALDLYKKMGIIDSVYVYSNRIMETGTIYAKELALSELVNYYSLKKDLLKVSKYLSLYRKMSDSVRVASATESVSRIHMLYNYSLREKKIHEIERNEQKRSIIYLSIFLISLSIFSFVCYLYERNKKKIYEYKSLVSHLEALYELSVSDNLKCKASYEKHIAELNEELSSIQSSLETYEYEVGSEKIHVYELIRRSIKYHKNLSSTDWNCITKSMEIISPRFKEKINSIYPVDSYDYKICMLVKLGFTNSDIATIMCRTDGTISVYRASLYKKFFKIKGKAKDFDNFICSL